MTIIIQFKLGGEFQRMEFETAQEYWEMLEILENDPKISEISIL